MAGQDNLGSRMMLDQSIIYLYNSYRQQGYSKEQAQELVTKVLDEVRAKYQAEGILPKHGVGLADPVRLLKEIREDVEKLGINPVARKHLLNKVIHLQKIIK